MSHSTTAAQPKLDAAFKIFGAVGILIAAVLTVGVLILTDPFGEYVTTSPAVFGSLLSVGLLAAVSYAAYALRRR